MSTSKSRRPVLPPNLMVLSAGDDQPRKTRANLESNPATSRTSFSGRTPIMETVADIEKERKAREISRMPRSELTIQDIVELKEFWYTSNGKTRIDIECRLFEIAVESCNSKLSGWEKRGFDELRVLAARVMFELPMNDKKEQMQRLAAAITHQITGAWEPVHYMILGLAESAAYGKLFFTPTDYDPKKAPQ